MIIQPRSQVLEKMEVKNSEIKNFGPKLKSD